MGVKVKNRPIVPGHEIVGIITKVGKNVKDWKVGDKAAFGTQRDICGKCKNCKNGNDNFCLDKSLDRFTYSDYHWGGYADQVQQPAKMFFKVPENIPDEAVPPLLCAGVTSYSPIKKWVKEGHKVGVIGVGGVGHMGLQYLKHWGAKATAFTTSKDKTDLLKKLGADDVVVSTEEGAVEKLAGEFDVVLNFLPLAKTDEFMKYFSMLGPLGTWVQIGVPPAKETIEFYLG